MQEAQKDYKRNRHYRGKLADTEQSRRANTLRVADPFCSGRNNTAETRKNAHVLTDKLTFDRVVLLQVLFPLCTSSAALWLEKNVHVDYVDLEGCHHLFTFTNGVQNQRLYLATLTKWLSFRDEIAYDTTIVKLLRPIKRSRRLTFKLFKVYEHENTRPGTSATYLSYLVCQ